MPPLLEAQAQRIVEMLALKLDPKDIASQEGVHIATVYRLRSNMRAFNAPYAPAASRPGPPKILTTAMEDALLEHLTSRPDLSLEEQKHFIWNTFDVNISIPTLSRTHKRLKWTRKRLQKRASERNEELRVAWMANLAKYTPGQLIFLDESAANEHTADRKYGWAPAGVTPIVDGSAARSERYSILPAYTVDGIMAYYIHQGSFTKPLFQWFVEQYVLPSCNPFPGQRSVLIVDNASIHRSQDLRDVCSRAQVLLLYLPPYSPDFNPIEEFFSVLKAWIKRNRALEDIHNSFEKFLQLAVNSNDGGLHSPAHFRHAGISVPEGYEGF